MRKKHRRNKERQPMVDPTEVVRMCAVPTCNCPAEQRHHYIPWRFLPENSFTIDLCPEHHKMIDKLLENIKECTPLKFFKIMFEAIYGRGSAYRNLKWGMDTMSEPRTSVHLFNPLRVKKGDDF